MVVGEPDIKIGAGISKAISRRIAAGFGGKHGRYSDGFVAAAVVAADAQTVMAWQSKPRPPSLQLTSGSTNFKLIGIDIAFVTVLASHCFSEYSLANYTSVVPEVEWCF
jgi:hypothetical protein